MSRRCDLYRRHVPCLCNTVVIPVVRAVRVEAVVEEAGEDSCLPQGEVEGSEVRLKAVVAVVV